VIFTAALQASGDFSRFNALRYVPNLATVTCLWLLAVCGRMTPLSASLCYLLPSLPITVYAGLFLLRQYRPTLRKLGLPMRRLTSYGLQVYGSDLIGTLSLQIDRLLVVGFLSPQQIGIYAVALAASRLPSVFYTAIAAVVLPETAGQPIAQIVAKVGRAARLTAMVTAAAAAGHRPRCAVGLARPLRQGLQRCRERVPAVACRNYHRQRDVDPGPGIHGGGASGAGGCSAGHRPGT